MRGLDGLDNYCGGGGDLLTTGTVVSGRIYDGLVFVFVFG